MQRDTELIFWLCFLPEEHGVAVHVHEPVMRVGVHPEAFTRLDCLALVILGLRDLNKAELLRPGSRNSRDLDCDRQPLLSIQLPPAELGLGRGLPKILVSHFVDLDDLTTLLSKTSPSRGQSLICAS